MAIGNADWTQKDVGYEDSDRSNIKERREIQAKS